MTQTSEGPPRGGGCADGPEAVCLSSSSAADGQTNSLLQRPAQAENDPSLITCASMRAQELRECLIREISRTIAIGLQAQAALFDGDDDAALASLFRHWFVLRDDVRPLLLELRDVLKQGGSP
jgi:hypothetical protein